MLKALKHKKILQIEESLRAQKVVHIISTHCIFALGVLICL